MEINKSNFRSNSDWKNVQNQLQNMHLLEDPMLENPR